MTRSGRPLPVEVHELGHPRVGGDRAEARLLGDVAEAARAARARVVAEEPRVVARLAEQQHVRPAVAVVVADRRAVAHVPLHQVAHGVETGKTGP